jgi:ribA/ribD-fused uncharacterized protein
MSEVPALPAVREWPGIGSGAKTDAYGSKIYDRHVKQYQILVYPSCPYDLLAYNEAEGGVCVYEKLSMRFVFFQGSWPSNFQPCLFKTPNGVLFNCTEQAFQALKALFAAKVLNAKGLDQHSESALQLYRVIMKSTNALFQKLSATAKFLYMDEEMRNTWMKISTELMFRLNLLKYRQNKHLRDRLLSLGECRIVEAIPDDTLWSIGMDAKTAIYGPPDAGASDATLADEKLKSWKGLQAMSKEEAETTGFLGQNRQGQVLMRVLREIRGGAAEVDGEDSEVREIVDDLLSRTLPAEDEESAEKKDYYAKLRVFETGPEMNIEEVLQLGGGESLPKKRPRSPTAEAI